MLKHNLHPAWRQLRPVLLGRLTGRPAAVIIIFCVEMVGVAQLVRVRIVDLGVAGSSPVTHPS